MIKYILILASLFIVLSAQGASDFLKEQQQGFEKEKSEFSLFKQNQQNEFKSYQEAQTKAYNEYKEEISRYWDEPKMSTKKRWVFYSEDKKTRTDVDFEKETIVVQTITSLPKEAKQKLQIALAKVVTIDTKTAHESDPLEKKLAEIKKPSSIIVSDIKPEPILSTVIFNKPPSKDVLISYIKSNVKDSNIDSHESQKLKNEMVYTLSIDMPKDAMLKRSKIYYNEVKKQADRQGLTSSLVFAVMHTESSFNPRARSHVPAFGLMQIVPSSAGVDTYKYLYNEKKIVSGSYLYDSTNNITMGSGYLHILYYRYLKKIKNPKSRLYCTIAAYNTGAGNIAWAFTRTNNMNKAAPIINDMTPEQVYNKLLKDLKYDEPKQYLKNVSKRINAYHKVYG